MKYQVLIKIRLVEPPFFKTRKKHLAKDSIFVLL